MSLGYLRPPRPSPVQARRLGAPHAELVDARTRNRLRRRGGQRAKKPEQGGLAGGDGRTSARTGSGLSAQEQGDVSGLAGEGNRAACMSTRQVRDLLGERPTPTTVVAAHETTCPQTESNLSAVQGTVRQTPLAVAVRTRGSPSASVLPPGPRFAAQVRYWVNGRPSVTLTPASTTPKWLAPRQTGGGRSTHSPAQRAPAWLRVLPLAESLSRPPVAAYAVSGNSSARQRRQELSISDRAARRPRSTFVTRQAHSPAVVPGRRRGLEDTGTGSASPQSVQVRRCCICRRRRADSGRISAGTPAGAWSLVYTETSGFAESEGCFENTPLLGWRPQPGVHVGSTRRNGG